MSLLLLVGCGGAPQADNPGDRSQIHLAPAHLEWKVAVDPARELVAIDPQAKVRVAVPKALDVEVVFPDCPSAFVAVGDNLSQSDVREVFDVQTNARVGSIRNARIFSGKTALSPDGRHFAAWTYGQDTIGLWDVAAETELAPISAKGSANPRMLMFAGNNRLIAIGGKDELLVWNVPGGAWQRTIGLPRAAGEPIVGLSPGGRYLAAAADEPGKHRLHVFDLESGASAGVIDASELDAQKTFRCLGLSFSTDGKELAALYDSFTTSALLVFQVADGKQAAHLDLADGLKAALTDYYPTRQRAVEWFPDNKRWLAFARVVIDRDAGKIAGELPEAPREVELTRHVFDNDHVLTAGFGMTAGSVVSWRLPLPNGATADGATLAGDLSVTTRPPAPIVPDASGAAIISHAGSASKWNPPIDPSPLGKIDGVKHRIPLKYKADTIKAVKFAPAAPRVVALIAQPARAPIKFADRNRAPQNLAIPTVPMANWIAVIDLVTGAETNTVEIPYYCDLMSVSPDGKRAVVRSVDDPKRLDVWSLDDGAHVAAWEPYGYAKDVPGRNNTYLRPVMQAIMVDSDHVATTTFEGKLVLSSISDRRIVYAFEKPAMKLYFSPTRKFLAIFSDKGCRFLDAMTGAVQGELPVPLGLTATVAFHPNGEQFAAKLNYPDGTHLVGWNLSTRAVEFDVRIPQGPQILRSLYWDSMQFRGNHFLLLDETALVDLKQKMIVWRYELPRGLCLAGNSDLRHWYLAVGGPRSKEVSLVGAMLPGSAMEEKLANGTFQPEMAIVPGSTVSMQIEFSVTHPFRKDYEEYVTKNIVAALKRNQVSIADGQRTIVKATLEMKSGQDSFDAEIKYVGGDKVERKREKLAKTELIGKIEIIHDGRAVWENKVYHVINSSSGIVTVPPGMTPMQVLTFPLWQSIDSNFDNVRIPPYVFAPSALEGLGRSELTADFDAQ